MDLATWAFLGEKLCNTFERLGVRMDRAIQSLSVEVSGGPLALAPQLVIGVFHYLVERLAHPPLGARASVERGVEVVVNINAGQQGGSLRLDGASCSLFC